MAATTQTRQEKLPEQIGQHVYKARASATTSTAPYASRHYAGHQAGIHPEDRPYLTGSKQQRDVSQNDEDDDALYPQRPPTSARRYTTEAQPATQSMPKSQGRRIPPMSSPHFVIQY